jgi:uncharacterized protein (TIGR01777 family)
MGAVVRRHFDPNRYRIAMVSRHPQSPDEFSWDGKSQGEWAQALDGADVVINLAGRSVSCHYNQANLNQMMDSRIQSTEAIGKAIEASRRPPSVWLQASTATIYAHTYGPANDEPTGVIGGNEPNVPAVWKFSVDIAQNWEAALDRADTPQTRKVAMRMAIMMSRDSGGPFDKFVRLARLGLGGRLGSGRQYISWVHELDLARAMEFLIDGDLSGPVNISSPNPLPQAEFVRDIRSAFHIPFGMPATPWMISVGTYLMNTHSELVLKSRRVVPTRLLEAGFKFEFDQWSEACADLVVAWRQER